MEHPPTAELTRPDRPCSDHWRGFFTGAVNMLPLCLSVLPWGILAGSMAVQSGLSIEQSVGMSAIVFAGAAQLVSLSLVMSGASFFTVVVSVFFITAQHFLYGLTLRSHVSRMKVHHRLPIGFLLTDELFALSSANKDTGTLTCGYLIGAGITFYLSWNLFSLLGILMASSVPDLDKYHLDFSIVATFITIVVPMIKKSSVLGGVIYSLLMATLLSWLHIGGAIVLAGITGMGVSVIIARAQRRSV